MANDKLPTTNDKRQTTNNQQPAISVCLITKNEQEYIEQCLNSVKDIADEIIIVDTGSTDSTIKIAEKFNAKIFHDVWKDDFSQSRNLSLRHASKEWILVIDADETISKNDLQKIKELTSHPEFDGYMLIQRTYTNDSNSPKWVSSAGDIYEESKPYSGWIYSGITRLFKNKPEIRFEYPVHETVKESIKRIKGKIGITKIPIHHYGKVRNREYVSKKSEMYLELGKKKLLESSDGKFHYELGIQAQVLEKFDEAIDAFNKAIEKNPQLIGAYVNLGNIYCRQRKYTEAIEILSKADKIDSSHSDLHNNLGIAYERLNQKKEALDEYRKAISLNPNNIEAMLNISRILFEAGELETVKMLLERVAKLNPKEWHAYNVLGVIYGLAGDLEASADNFRKTVEIFPSNEDAIVNLANTYIAMGKKKEAKETFERLVSLGYNEEDVKKKLETLK